MLHFHQLPFLLHRSLILFVVLWLGLGTLPHALAERADADVLVARGILAYDEKRYEKALKLLNQALELESKDPRALLYKGLVFLAQYNPERAVGPLEKAYELRPDDPPQGRGTCHLCRGPAAERAYGVHPQSRETPGGLHPLLVLHQAGKGGTAGTTGRGGR